MDTGEIVGKCKFPTEDISISEADIEEALLEYAVKIVKAKNILGPFKESFKQVEEEEHIISDVIINTNTFELLRKYCKDTIDPITDGSLLKKGLMAYMWGALVWVTKKADKIYCFMEGSKELEELFPFIAEAKKSMKL